MQASTARKFKKPMTKRRADRYRRNLLKQERLQAQAIRQAIQQGASIYIGASDWVQEGNNNFNKKEMLWKCSVKYQVAWCYLHSQDY